MFSGSYYAEYQKQKQLKANRKLSSLNNFSSKLTQTQTKHIMNSLTDSQLIAYKWLLKKGIIVELENPTQKMVVNQLCMDKFNALFKIGISFGVITSRPQTNMLNHIRPCIASLVEGLQSKGILPNTVNIDLLVRCDKCELLSFMVLCYNASITGPKNKSTLDIVNQWLLSIGIEPPDSYGGNWFSVHPLHLVLDPLRNGEIFCELCRVFRPEIFNGAILPASSQRQMIERTHNALKILANSCAIDESDIILAEEIVKGKNDAAERLLVKIHSSYKKREEDFLKVILPKMK